MVKKSSEQRERELRKKLQYSRIRMKELAKAIKQAKSRIKRAETRLKRWEKGEQRYLKALAELVKETHAGRVQSFVETLEPKKTEQNENP